MPPVLPAEQVQRPSFLGVQQAYVLNPDTQILQPVPDNLITIAVRYPQPDQDEAVKFFLSCIPDPAKFLAEQHRKIASMLRSDKVLPIRYRTITLSLKHIEGLADTQGDTITLSLPWISSWATKSDLAAATLEFQGVITHELVHVMQYDGEGSASWWWIEGLADYVRWKLDLAPPHWGKRGEGDSHEDGYSTTAHFLDWLSERKLSQHLVQEINARLMAQGWKEEWFEELTGLPVKTLWDIYKAQQHQ
ncbi:hypothetical protein QFC19_002308 [Naganishia cerealis]|uniref:Uncharacterized protein n=1 Tax=Naganishia cerealis TaxID=610337 RepID=A0ACC2WAC6_9TREE|nr:hypothetical protein QFC19_002308 [Naganishia cerealis]